MKLRRGLILIAAGVALAGCSSGSGNPATTAPRPLRLALRPPHQERQ